MHSLFQTIGKSSKGKEFVVLFNAGRSLAINKDSFINKFNLELLWSVPIISKSSRSAVCLEDIICSDTAVFMGVV